MTFNRWVLLGALFSMAAWAQDGELDVDALSLDDLLRGEVVVTASKREQLSSASLSTTSVITREEIKASPYLFLGEFLSHVPGLDVRWGKMQRLYVGARGLGGTALSSRMLLLWDGQPMNDPLTGDLSVGHFVPLVDVERIEIIRGAGSTMYGSNAFSGVINVLTRSGGQLRAEEGTRTEVEALFGSFASSRLQASHVQSLGGVRLGAWLEALRSDGPLPVLERYEGMQLEQIKNDDLQTVSTGLSARYGDLNVSGSYTYGERGLPGTLRMDSEGNILECTSCHSQGTYQGRGLKYPPTPNSCGTCHTTPHDREARHQASFSASYERSLSDALTLQAHAHHREFRTGYEVFRETEFLGPTQNERLSVAQRSSGAEIDLRHSIGKVNSLVAGVEARFEEVASELLAMEGEGHVVDTNLAVFAEDEFKPREWLSLTAGLRADWDPHHGVALSPRGGVVATISPRLSLKAGVSRAFRKPSIAELRVASRERYMVLGNPELRPEWVTSVEAGGTYSRPVFEEAVARLTATGFFNRATDLIAFSEGVNRLPTFENVDQVNGMGGELEAELEVREPQLKFFANYTMQTLRSSSGAVLPYAPRHKGGAGLQAKIERFTYLVRGRVVGERYDDGGLPLAPFAMLDAAVTADLWKNFKLSLQVTNLTDSQHQESLGTPTASRAFYLVLGYR